MTIAGVLLFIIVFGFILFDPTKNPIGITLFSITLTIVAVANRTAIWAWIKNLFVSYKNGDDGSQRKSNLLKTIKSLLIKLLLWIVLSFALFGLSWLMYTNGALSGDTYGILKKMFYVLVGLTWIVGSIDIIKVKL